MNKFFSHRRLQRHENRGPSSNKQGLQRTYLRPGTFRDLQHRRQQQQVLPFGPDHEWTGLQHPECGKLN